MYYVYHSHWPQSNSHLDLETGLIFLVPEKMAVRIVQLHV